MMQEEYLKCSCCHGYYVRPKILSCLHSFCYDCINRWIAERTPPDVQFFDCPICGTQHPIPENEVKADGFLDDFKISHLVEGLQDFINESANQLNDNGPSENQTSHEECTNKNKGQEVDEKNAGQNQPMYTVSSDF